MIVHSAFDDYAKAVEEAFRELMPGPGGARPWAVHTHRGKFGLDEIRHYAVRAPAVILTPLGIGKLGRGGGDIMAPVQYGAVILTKDGASVDARRQSEVWRATEAVLRWLPWQAFGCTRAPKPEDIEVTNAYSDELDAMGLSMWVVGWEQTVVLQAMTDEEHDALDDFLTMHVEYGTDADDVDQTIELEGPA